MSIRLPDLKPDGAITTGNEHPHRRGWCHGVDCSEEKGRCVPGKSLSAGQFAREIGRVGAEISAGWSCGLRGAACCNLLVSTDWVSADERGLNRPSVQGDGVGAALPRRSGSRSSGAPQVAATRGSEVSGSGPAAGARRLFPTVGSEPRCPNAPAAARCGRARRLISRTF